MIRTPEETDEVRSKKELGRKSMRTLRTLKRRSDQISYASPPPPEKQAKVDLDALFVGADLDVGLEPLDSVSDKGEDPFLEAIGSLCWDNGSASGTSSIESPTPMEGPLQPGPAFSLDLNINNLDSLMPMDQGMQLGAATAKFEPVASQAKPALLLQTDATTTGTKKGGTKLTQKGQTGATPAAEKAKAKGKAKGTKKPKRSKEESKAKHRLVERHRTRRLNALIARLKGQVQMSGMSVRKDKASVLESAIDCIKNMRIALEEVSNRLTLAGMREQALLKQNETIVNRTHQVASIPHSPVATDRKSVV